MRLALALVVSLAAAPMAAADPVDDTMLRQMSRSHIPGAAVAVVENGRVVKLSGYGTANLEWDRPADPDTAFQIASATKLFTGVVLMRLVERGALSLDDPLAKYYPDSPEAWRGITVGQLASHTSGLPQGFGGPRPNTFAEALAAAKQAPLAYPPGTKSQYGLTDFVILQAILETVSGKTLPALFDVEIIGPLGLTHTGYSFAANRGPVRWSAVLPQRASVYAWQDDAQHVSDGLYGEFTYAAGGLFSSASDLAKLFAALDEGRLLKPESVRLLATPATLNDGRQGGFGIAWTTRVYRGESVVGHSGGPALADVLRSEKRKLTVIVLTNQHRFYPLLAERVADHYLPEGPRAAAIRDGRPALTAALKRIFATAAAGQVDAALFTEAGAKEMVPFFGEMRPTLLTAVGPLTSAELIGEAVDKGKITRRYRVAFETRELFWRLTASADGRIEALIPVGEAD